MATGLDQSIDQYLSGRGSPMAGLGSTFVAAGRKYGVDPRMLVGIGVIESGAGKAMKNRNNFANWGVHRGQEYDSYGAAIEDLARGLRSGYLDHGLDSPEQIVTRYAPSSDGNNEHAWASTVSGVIRQLGGKSANLALQPQAPPTTVGQVARQAQAEQPVYDPLRFSSSVRDQFIAGGGRIDLGGLPQTQQASFTQSPLKLAPTDQVQARGIVSPGGDLKDPASVNANPILKAASTQIGKPYVFGSGPSTASFDCSDLIQWSYGQAGIQLPRTTYQQVKVGREVDVGKEPLHPGDLIFPSAHHVVMYVGDGKVIAAPHTGTVVQYQPLSRFGKLYAVRRVLPG